MAHETYVQPASLITLPRNVLTDVLGNPPTNGAGIPLGGATGRGTDALGVTILETGGVNAIDHVYLYVSANDNTHYVQYGADLGPIPASGSLPVDLSNIPYGWVRVVLESVSLGGATARVAARGVRVGV